ncbi:MAG TPA: TonB-dependent receptor [Terriglobales bacterium]
MPIHRVLILGLLVSGLTFAQALPSQEQPAQALPPQAAPAPATSTEPTQTLAPTQAPSTEAPAQQPSIQSAQPAQASESPAATIAGGDVHGVVKAGNTPLPGATITAANTLTGKKISTSTAIDGSYALHLSSNGRYVIRAEMPAFAAATSEALINATNRDAKVDLNLMLASRAATQAQQQQGAIQQLAQALGNRGFQSLSVSGADVSSFASSLAGGGENNLGGNASGNGNMPDSGTLANAGMPSIGGEGASESVSVSGAMGRTQTFGMSQDDIEDRIREFRERGGQQGGPGGMNIQFGPGGGGPGGGGPPMGGGGGPVMIFAGGGRGFGNLNINKPHGMIYYQAGNSVFDAKPYSLTGQPTAKPDYNQGRIGAFLGGPLNIPKIYNGGMKTFFFGGFSLNRVSNPYDVFSTVPTSAERNGDFSAAQITSGPSAGLPVQIFDPVTRQPFPGNVIPPSQINPAAQSLLRFFPLPNLPGATQNFHYVTSLDNNSDSVNLRIVHNFGQAGMFGPFGEGGGGGRGGRGGGRGGRNRPHNNINFGFNYQGSHSNQATPFPTLGGTNKTRGFSLNGGWNFGSGRFNNNLRFNWNHNRIDLSNLYANKLNVAGQAGITGVSQDPFDYGVPRLSFTNFRSLSDISGQLRNDNTYTFSEGINWSRGKHNLRVGGDYRRILQDLRSNQNARGSFTFTGFATGLHGTSSTVATTGFDFADFLLGLPQQSSIQSGASTYGFRANSWDLFVEDNWRATANLTFNLGLRYEYISPYSEKNNRIVNLDVAPGFVAVSPVLPDASGKFTGDFPVSLIEPDRNNFAPRVGVAWKAFKNTVVRAGYGINYNLGQYGNMVQQLAFQPPFAVTETNSAFLVPITLQNGFPTSNPASVTNNFAVDKNYTLGYVQLWNLDVQREITPSLLLNVGYNGAKGSHLDMERAPNRCLPGQPGCDPSGLRIADVQPFIFESSQGSSTLHAATVRLRKRMAHGLSMAGSYTFSKSIDNASSIGGGAAIVAQNDLDLAAERGLSSFDQHHRFTGDFLFELPFGQGKMWLNHGGPASAVFGDWQLSGNFTMASGTPFTPRVIAISTVAQGASGSLRANYTGAPISLSDPTVLEWFNTAAFVAPGPTQYGDARRNSIPGPGLISVDMAVTKTIQMKETRALEFRAQANNVFNTVHFASIDAVVNSPTFGQVLSTGSMRRLQLMARYRF